MGERHGVEANSEGANRINVTQLDIERRGTVLESLKVSVWSQHQTYMLVSTGLETILKGNDGTLGLAAILVKVAVLLYPVNRGRQGSASCTC